MLSQFAVKQLPGSTKVIRSVGLDLVDIARIQRDLDLYGSHFVQKILGPNELLVFERRHDKALFLAGRFAAKEAIIKGLGAYIENRPAFSSLEIINSPSGQPEIHFPEDVSGQLGNSTCFISITHERQFAAAVAVFSEDK